MKRTRSTVQQKFRQMQDKWLRNKADEIQSYADRKGMKNFYASLKEVYGPISSGSAPLLSADVPTLITDKDKLLERWAEYFDNVLIRPSAIKNEAINRLALVPIDGSLDDAPSLGEIQKGIHLLSSGKAPRADSI